MNRVYLDWVVFTRLKQKKETEEPYRTLYSIIQNNRDKLLFPYSHAHLSDLKRGFFKSEKAQQQTYEDLNFLKEISQDHSIYKDHKEKREVAGIRDPKEYFDQLKDDKTLENLDLDNLFDLDEDDELGKLWGSYMDLLKTIQSGIDFNIDNLPSQYDALKDIYQNTREENNFYNLLKDFMSIVSSPEKYSQVYKTSRNKFIEDMKIDTNPQNWGDPFQYLDKVVAKGKLNNSFREMVEESLKRTNKGKEPTKFQYFTNYFISLDTYGYYRDKKMTNLIDDATHAYYGAHCDYFVTDDRNTYQKARAVYEQLNIETIVCTSQEFPSFYYSKNLIQEKPTESLTERISKLIEGSIILMNTVDDELNPVTVHKVNMPFLYYFTRMQISHYDDSTVLSFYKKRDNYSNFMFWTEIKTIINKLYDEWGIDDNLRAEFDEKKEKPELNNNKWPGRIWTFNEKVNSGLVYLEYPFGLSLRVRVNKTKE